MKCPFCNNTETQVKDSRPTEDGSAIRRRRLCPACGSRFTSFERVQLRDLTVIKKDGKNLLPKLHGALLKNEQDIQLFERIAFMARGDS